MSLLDDLVHASTSLFTRENPEPIQTLSPYDYSAYNIQDQIPSTTYMASNFISMIYTQIAMDVASTRFQHIIIDRDGNRTTVTNSDLAHLFDVEANIDQTSTDFFHDLAYTLFKEGVVAVVPVKGSSELLLSGPQTFAIDELRIGIITDWYPTKVKVRLYNDVTGKFSEVIVEKRRCAIIENPLHNVIGKNNPTYNRLLNRLSALDKISSETINSRLNMILQLNVPLNHDKRKDIAERRIHDIQTQLTNSKFGIAYTGSDEKITQVSTGISSNTMLDEVKYLTDELLNSLGLSRNVFNGTATIPEMEHYWGRTIEPITRRIAEEFQRKFLSKTAYTRGHRVFVYQDPFRLMSVTEIAGTMDALLRNSILTPNEARSKIGFGPSDNPLADQLYNRNMPMDQQGMMGMEDPNAMPEDPNAMPEDPNAMPEDPNAMPEDQNQSRSSITDDQLNELFTNIINRLEALEKSGDKKGE